MSREILTITLNPSVDKNFVINKLIADHKLRCANPQIDPGGGGINVSKALSILETSSTAAFFCGGRNGTFLCDLLNGMGVEIFPIWIKGETRENIVISETESNQQYKLVAEGPAITSEDAQIFRERIESENWKPRFLVGSGSPPPGMPVDIYARMANWAIRNNARFVLDTSGEALEAAMAEGVFLIKPNLRELSLLVGAESLELGQVKEAAKQLISRGGCEMLVVSMGPSGALLVTRDGAWQQTAPTVVRKSTVGAGDSMVGGMIWALQKGYAPSEMLRMGVACGTAATMNPGTRLFQKDDVFRLYNWMSEQK